MPNVVQITDAAKRYISERCNGQSMVLLVKINGKGCSGHSYEYSLVDPNTLGKFDEIVIWTGGGLAIDSTSVVHVIGSTLDLRTSMIEEVLFWVNPHASNPCGCGESFALRS